MTRPAPGDLVIVAAGAAAGALLRWGVVAADPTDGLPWATLGVNVGGAFLIGALPAIPAVRRSRRVRLLAGPGLLGGFTTVSAWAGQVTGLAALGQVGLAGLLVAVTVGGGVAAAHLGRYAALRTGAPP